MFAALLVGVGRAQAPLGSGFTYQANLHNAGAPVNGSVNLVARLYDAAAGGTLLGSQTLNGVVVTEGLFTVTLNAGGQLGSDAINGDRRWLEFSVNGTTLAPRQELSAAPYALGIRLPLVERRAISAGRDALFDITNTATTGVIPAIRGSTDSEDAGAGVLGIATATGGTPRGVHGVSFSPTGAGVFGENHATGLGIATGVLGYTEGPLGSGVWGANGSATGETAGVMGVSVSSSGRGVVGTATSGNGSTFGVYGSADSRFGTGVRGFCPASGSSDTPYGVRGSCSTGTQGYAVYAAGDLGASGVKSFRIDHPDDPANKYLLHYASESPEVINFYRGTVTLDADGQALVELPAYFAKVNKSPSYQLTAIGAPMPNLYVAEEISEAALTAGANAPPSEPAPRCTFRIAGGTANGKVSWRVEAQRNDLRMRLYGAPVEREKTGPERGKVQHPEYYGVPAELGMDSPMNTTPSIAR